jgi:AraC-like DNA-binding protein
VILNSSGNERKGNYPNNWANDRLDFTINFAKITSRPQKMSLIEPFSHALPVSNVRFHEEFYLTHAGWERIAPDESYPHPEQPMFSFEWDEGRTLPESCLALLSAGLGELQTRGGRFPLAAGDAFLVSPGEWHRHRPSPATGWSLMWICFHGDEPARWQRQGLYTLRGNLAEIEDSSLFRAQFERLLEHAHRSPSTNSANLTRQAMGLLSHLLSEGGDETGDELVNRAIAYIWNFSHWLIDVPAVARRVGVARRTLDRRFAAARGQTVLEEINSCRLTRAARLMTEGQAFSQSLFLPFFPCPGSSSL